MRPASAANAASRRVVRPGFRASAAAHFAVDRSGAKRRTDPVAASTRSMSRATAPSLGLVVVVEVLIEGLLGVLTTNGRGRARAGLAESAGVCRPWGTYRT